MAHLRVDLVRVGLGLELGLEFGFGFGFGLRVTGCGLRVRGKGRELRVTRRRVGASARLGSHSDWRGGAGAIPIRLAVRIRAVWCWIGVCGAFRPVPERMRRIGCALFSLAPLRPGTSVVSVRGESVR